MVAFVGGRFAVAASMTFAAWYRHGSGFQLHSLIKYEYVGQWMVIFSMTADGPKAFGAIGVDENPGASATLELPDFTSDFMCHVYIAERGAKTHSLAVVMPRGTGEVMLEKRGTVYTITQSSEFREKMRRRLAALISARQASS